MSFWMENYSKNIENLEAEYLTSQRLMSVLNNNKTDQNETVENFQKFLKKKNIIHFKPAPVIHCEHSTGIVIRHGSGWKISYSGDCRPDSKKFLKASKNADLIIHEATFGNCMG